MTVTTPWSVEDILTATGGELWQGGREQIFDDIVIDSRKSRKGLLFVALRGKNHDGHDFVPEVLRRGARGVLVEKAGLSQIKEPLQRSGAVCLVVEDSVRALGRLGLYRRRHFNPVVAAITGTNGKTTTREMLRGVATRHFPVLAPEANFNNEIGVPLTLLRLEKEHRAVILELGMNAPDEIKRLAEISRPDIGVVLNVGAGHLAGLGDVEGVARAKRELVEALPETSTTVLNADDHRVRKMAEKASGRVVTFGRSSQADVRAVRVEREAFAITVEIVFSQGEDSITVHLPVVLEEMVSNALAAAAVADLLGVSKEDIRAGLEAFVPVRMKVITTAAGFTVIDDSYNANPDSLVAAVSALTALPGAGRKILVVGDMYELGDAAEEMHRAAGSRAATAGVDKIFAVGEFAASVAAGAGSAGLPDEDIVAATKEEAIKLLSETIASGDLVLVKGSRAMAMETVVAGLLEATGRPSAAEQEKQKGNAEHVL